MKCICFVIHSVNGGCGRVVSVLSKYFTEENYDITVISLYEETSFYELPENVRFVSLKDVPPIKKGIALARICNVFNEKIIIGIGMNKLNSWLAVHSFLFQGNYKLIAAEHINFNSATFLQKAFKFLLYRRFSAIVVLTSSNKEKYIKYGLKNVYVIPNIASFMPSDIADYKEREQIILIVGRLGRQKNISDMVTIWGNIYSKYSRWKLLIIGEGSESEKLKQLIHSKGIPDTQCQLINSQKDICKYYNNAQIVTLTSLFEGLPMVLIEAMACGCPCISYDCETGPSDIIVNNQTGFLIPCSDLEKFQEKLEILLNNEELRMQFFQRSLIERYRFSSSEILHKWFSLFNN